MVGVMEAGGVDTDGDGKIDNYSDVDNDGFSQNVDANTSGKDLSGNGLALPDLDGDGIPNYLDLDSDNDGITDVLEVKMGLLYARTKLTLVGEEEGRKGVLECQLAAGQ